jgi:hypothetical protein
MTILKVLSCVSADVLWWSSTVEKEYERPVRDWVGLLVALVTERFMGVDNVSEICESDQTLWRASISFALPASSSVGRKALFGGVSGMKTNGAA